MDEPPVFLSNIVPLVRPTLTALDTGKTPAEWIEILATKSIVLSERSLREMANKLGARVKIGRTMLITPEQMETILNEGTACRSRHTSETASGGRKAASSTKAKRSPATTESARALLQSKLHSSGASTRRSANDVSTSSGRKRTKKGR